MPCLWLACILETACLACTLWQHHAMCSLTMIRFIPFILLNDICCKSLLVLGTCVTWVVGCIYFKRVPHTHMPQMPTWACRRTQIACSHNHVAQGEKHTSWGVDRRSTSHVPQMLNEFAEGHPTCSIQCVSINARPSNFGHSTCFILTCCHPTCFILWFPGSLARV